MRCTISQYMENKMFNDIEAPLLRLYRTEYNADYRRMKKMGHEVTESDVRHILGYPAESRKKFWGLF